MRWIIVNTARPNLYWSNVLGWVGRHSCDVFTEHEATHLNLPMEGKWKRISLQNGATEL